MRNAIVGIIIGVVIGVVVGATVLGPRLDQTAGASTADTVENLSPPPDPEPKPEPEPENLKSEISWRMASAYGGALPQIGRLAKRVETEIWRVSDGEMQIRVHEPDTLVPVNETFDAVASGAVDAAFASPGLWKDKVPALQLFASVPFGPDPSEFIAWIYFGGGKELFEEIYHRHKIHSVFCGLLAPEASGWFRREILTVDDLKGLRMRFFGLGADVMQKLGVETSSLTDSEIFQALEANRIDGAEFSMPSIDLQLGLYRMAKHYYFPGWHQPATLFELMINLENWNSLSSSAKARVESVCGDNVRYGLADGEAAQFAALKALYAKDVEIHEWPREIMEALETAWKEVAAEHSQEDEDFRRVWKSLSAFREDYSVWRELSRIRRP